MRGGRLPLKRSFGKRPKERFALCGAGLPKGGLERRQVGWPLFVCAGWREEKCRLVACINCAWHNGPE
ncbi:hypothetical protein GCM10023186_24480 [Hymenobacter koreensis]|uniref:Uncharacterized protein n=1 Tax=Hymenobacter koreensis TaxID=1084523 RepID=A0ABP8J1M3_9BACT